MRKNQYEEALFRAEDDRFELDMVIECGASAIQRLQPLAEQLQGLEADERANFRIPDGVMGPIHYRAVQKIYGGATLSTVVVHSVFSCLSGRLRWASAHLLKQCKASCMAPVSSYWQARCPPRGSG